MYGTFELLNSWGWKIPSLLQCLPSVCQLVLAYLVPDVAKAAYKQRQTSEAKTILN